MIEVKNLCRYYPGFDGHDVKALDNVSFTLPDKGLIFITGKSGSGKSTLLNVLGGLDSMTSGEVIVDGYHLSEMKNSDFDDYRNEYIGFIFQDFCLLPDYTVEENIALPLTLQNKKNKRLVNALIDRVGLHGYNNRLPKQLSGGEKQRTAIARALVKSPMCLLADEPTGNLDSKNSKAILDILKELSKTCLLVVVSHDIESAKKYADRIIEIKDGHINSDKTRNLEYKEHNQDVVEVKDNINLSNSQIAAINEQIFENNVVFVKESDMFVPTENKHIEMENVSLKRFKFPLAHTFKLYTKLLKSGWVSTTVSAVFITAVITIMALCQMFSTYDGNQNSGTALQQANEYTFILEKAMPPDDPTNSQIDQRKSDLLYPILEDELKAFEDNTNYYGGIYPVYNLPLITGSNNYYSLECFSNFNGSNLYSNGFSVTARGCIVTDINFLQNLYGVTMDGANVLEGSLTTMEPHDLIITDYFADTLIYYNNGFESDDENHPYKTLVESHDIYGRYSIGAVIDTQYKERYRDFLEEYFDILYNGNGNMAQMLRSPEYNQAFSELNACLNVCYSINPNFIDDYVDSGIMHFARLTTCYVTTEDGLHRYRGYGSGNVCYPDDSLTGNQIKVSRGLFTELYGEEIANAGVVPEGQVKKVKFTNYTTLGSDFDPAFEETYEVVGIREDADNVSFSREAFKKVQKGSIYPYALAFDDIYHVYDMYDIGYGMRFFTESTSFNIIILVVRAVMFFNEVFNILLILLLIAIACIAVTFAVTSVTKKTYTIGVTRALGGRNWQIAIAFVMQILTVGIICSAVSFGLIAFFTQYLNAALLDAFYVWNNYAILYDLAIVYFKPDVVGLDLLFFLIVIVVCSILPFIIAHNVKPSKIIKSSD